MYLNHTVVETMLIGLTFALLLRTSLSLNTKNNSQPRIRTRGIWNSAGLLYACKPYEEGYLCDPDNFLSSQDFKIVNEFLKAEDLLGQNGCKLEIFAVLFYEIDPFLMELSGNDAQLATTKIARQLRLSWRNPFCCGSVVIAYSHREKVVVTSFCQETFLTDCWMTRILAKNLGFFRRGEFKQGILRLSREFREIFRRKGDTIPYDCKEDFEWNMGYTAILGLAALAVPLLMYLSFWVYMRRQNMMYDSGSWGDGSSIDGTDSKRVSFAL